LKPGNIFLPNWKGRKTALDITVISPLCQSYVKQASKTTGAALAIRAQEKRRVHHAHCRAQGIKFVPLVVESLGGWDADAVAIIREMTKQMAFRSNTPPSVAINQSFQCMGILLQRSNATLMAMRGPSPQPSYIDGVR
jgi:hypothetical protein